MSDQFLRHDVQEVCERTSALEGRLSLVEDDLNPMKQEIKSIREQLNMYIYKMDDMENRLRRKNLRVVGLPKQCEGSNPTEYMEDWLKGIFGKESVNIFCN